MNKVSGKKICSNWKFTDEQGSFEWKNPHTLNQLYFPICNEAGFMGSVTPTLHGDATSGQHSFLRLPITLEDLHNTKSERNFWIYSKKFGAYSLTGNSAKQKATLFTADDNLDIIIKGTFLAHTVIRNDHKLGINSEIVSFAPVSDDKIEILKFKITNNSDEVLSFTPTSSMPLYCRSADNLRDHRHWTSLALRMKLTDYGIIVKPVIHHDERGHKPNNTNYFVFAFGSNDEKPIGKFPTVAEFIGEGGSFEWPKAVVQNIQPYQIPPNRRDGMDAVGALRFKDVKLQPDESKEYIIIEGSSEDDNYQKKCLEKYGSLEKVQKAYYENLEYWQKRINKITFNTSDRHFNIWMRWVALQPILRKIYGNSFLPHFDYGRGGRGWRDLWQDCLALLLQNPDEVRDILVDNFEGIRLDGSNATIIEKGSGKFSADRNKISRVWMDHGVWPYYTIKLYIDQTGDLEILFEEKPYWKDHQIKRAKDRDNKWHPDQGTIQKTSKGRVYLGTIIEHILVQHLTCFHNVGRHNNIKLEDADWNDLLDMANINGESVPFSAFYGWNLISIAETLKKYKKVYRNNKLKLFKELLLLTGLNDKIDYNSPFEKQKRLNQYFESVYNNFSGEKTEVEIDLLAEDLILMGKSILEHIRNSEWIESKTEHGFFNGYYNNDGERVDGDYENCNRMNLTGQTFAIMTGAATDEQVRRAYNAASSILKDPNTGGYRLTTPLGSNTLNFGRGYAVVYGEKETGGTFNHMVVMFLNGLYKRNFIKEAYEVFTTIYKLANNTEKAKIYPGIPEYFNHEGRGMYPYLSGSASWLLMTVLTEMFGIKGEYGDFVIEPKLLSEQFDNNGIASVNTYLYSKRVQIIYENLFKLNFNEYSIANIHLNGTNIEFEPIKGRFAKLKKKDLNSLLKKNEINFLKITLNKI